MKYDAVQQPLQSPQGTDAPNPFRKDSCICSSQISKSPASIELELELYRFEFLAMFIQYRTIAHVIDCLDLQEIFPAPYAGILLFPGATLSSAR